MFCLSLKDSLNRLHLFKVKRKPGNTQGKERGATENNSLCMTAVLFPCLLSSCLISGGYGEDLRSILTPWQQQMGLGFHSIPLTFGGMEM